MGSSIKKNFIYNSLYQILLIILPLVTTPYISRVLLPKAIGEYSFAFSIATYFVIFENMGLSNYGNRTIAINRDNRERLSKTFFEIFIMQLMMSFLIVGIYIVIMQTVYNGNIFLKILLPYVLSGMLDINWFFFGIEEFKPTVSRNIIIKCMSTIMIFLFVKSPEDIYVYTGIMSLSFLLSQIVIWPFLFKYVDLYKIHIKDVLKHIKPNMLLFIPVLAISIYKYMDKIMLGSISSKEQVGYYECVDKIVNVPMALISSLGTVMLPRISNMTEKKQGEKIRKYFKLSIAFAMLLSSSLCFGIMGIAPVFVPLYYGEGYNACISLFQILMPSCLFLAFANVIRTQYLIPYKRDNEYICSVILGAVMNFIINLLLIPQYAAVGAAVGTLIAQASVCIYQTIVVWKPLELKECVKNVIPFCVSGGVMYLIVYALSGLCDNKWLNLMILIIVGTIIYILFLAAYAKSEQGKRNVIIVELFKYIKSKKKL